MVPEPRPPKGRSMLTAGWTMLALGAGGVGLAALMALPALTGEGCGMQAMPYVLSLPVGVPLMVGGLYLVWAAQGASVAAQRGGQGTRGWGVVVDVGAFLAITALAIVALITLPDPISRGNEKTLAVGLGSLAACALLLCVERWRLRRG